MNISQVLIDPSPERVVLDFRTLGFHDVVVIGRYRYSSSQPGLDMHKHDQMIEICLLDKGRQVYVVEGQEYVLESGDVFVTYPGELHGTGDHPESKGVLYWLILNVPKSKDRFLSLPPSDWHAILGPLLKRRPRVFRGVHQLKTTLDHIIAVYDDSLDPMRRVNLQNWMLRFLIDTIACSATPVERSPSEEIQEVIAVIEDSISEGQEISLRDLASLAGLSLSRFQARFRSEVGTPIAEFIVRNRVEKASELLLQSDSSVTEIAMQLGFSTSQYFSTVYKRFTGKTPREVRCSRDSHLS